MSGKVLIEFDDSEARRIEALASSLGMTSDEVSHLLASLAGELSEAILRLPSEKRDEFRRSLARFPDHSSRGSSASAVRAEKPVSELFRIMAVSSEADDSERRDDSDIVDDEELSNISDRLMTRKAELYRRLAR